MTTPLSRPLTVAAASLLLLGVYVLPAATCGGPEPVVVRKEAPLAQASGSKHRHTTKTVKTPAAPKS